MNLAIVFLRLLNFLHGLSILTLLNWLRCLHDRLTWIYWIQCVFEALQVFCFAVVLKLYERDCFNEFYLCL